LSVLVLGVGSVLVTHFVLKDCADVGHMMKTASGMSAPMRCFYTERAVDVVGGLVAVMGLVMLWQREASRAVSAAAAAAGLVLIAIPLWLLPTCPDGMMECNLSLKPGVIMLGVVITVVGLAAAVQSRRIVNTEASA
jgi:uncharacterized membrane protein